MAASSSCGPARDFGVTVKTVKGSSVVARLWEDDSLHMLKCAVALALDVAPSTQRLVFKGRVLHGDKNGVRKLGLKEGDVVHLVARRSSLDASARSKEIKQCRVDLLDNDMEHSMSLKKEQSPHLVVSQPTEENATLCGVAKKRGGWGPFKRFQSRYLVLSDGVLIYSRSPGGKPRGSIPLHDARIVPREESLTLEVFPNSTAARRKLYIFQFANSEELDIWTEHMQSCTSDHELGRVTVNIDQ